MTGPLGEDVNWLQRSVTSSPGYGNDVFTWTTVEICNAIVIPGSSTRGVAFTTERVQGQDVMSADMTLIIPARYAVDAADRFQVRGLTYEIDGAPAVSKNPWTARTTQMVRLKRVRG